MVESRKVPVIYTESSRDFHEIPLRTSSRPNQIPNAFRWGDESAYQPQPRTRPRPSPHSYRFRVRTDVVPF